MKRTILLSLLIIYSTFSVVAQNTMTPEDVANTRYVSGVEMSPDGKFLAYRIISYPDPTIENRPAHSHLYLYDIDNQKHIPFVTQYDVSNVTYRPNHSSITFIAKREEDKNSSIYEISLSGGEALKLFEHEEAISSYDWHPDGNSIAFIAKTPQESEDSELPYTPEIYEENLNSNSAYVVNLGTMAVERADLPGHVTHIEWGPGGTHLAISSAPTSLIDNYYTSQKVNIVDASTMTVNSLIDHTAKLGDFTWSPEGDQIAFIAGGNKHDPIAGRMVLSDTEGGTPTVMLKEFGGAFESLKWTDDNTITFLASEGVASTIGTLTTKEKMKKLFSTAEMSISAFDVGHDKVAMVASTPSHPSELYIMDIGDDDPLRLTISNPWIDDLTLGKQEVVTYKADDGMEIQGILIHPVGGIENAPMITVVHGGPEAHYDNGWLTAYSIPGQVAAGKGFAVFYPNYRGSTGRGMEYAMSSQGDPAGKEFDDIIDGLDYLIDNYGIDEDRIGVTGGSYGGYATAWMSTRHTERFAAGVMFVGISNNLSKWGTSDIPEEMFLVHSRKRIWDDYEFFLERSPIYYAGQAETPLLIMAGKEDTRVDPGQSYELYRHIKTRTDTPVRLVLYPGEGHGNRNSTARYDYNLRMLRWFDTYLRGSDNKMPEVTLETK
ncbi:S9 family peptidase [Mangrovivirga cuniculi]|uniref:S9 family peptidase n=1 Tax=Mangrovivirga cuniculi TaxID=2715131 RepID=A0A4D7KAZ0_9BACT|nr:S9 family peptidase [Mangrovivirga cuniculi]QCK16568.1 S9 family peptidase [Mangrovivirga cuniculi]